MVRISPRDIIKPSYPSWELYFTKFPNCISPNNKWNSNQGISVSIRITENASDSSEGNVQITFDSQSEKKVLSMLNEWMKAHHNPETGARANINDLMANVMIVDQNEVEKTKNWVLKFLTQFTLELDTPNICAVYYES